MYVQNSISAIVFLFCVFVLLRLGRLGWFRGGNRNEGRYPFITDYATNLYQSLFMFFSA